MATPQERLAAETVLSDEEKELLMVETIKEFDSRKGGASGEKQVMHLALGNLAGGVLLLKEIYPFSGHWQDSGPPAELFYKRFQYCVHECDPIQGSKVGVSYFLDGKRWIFAWHVFIQDPISTDVLRNKVYCEHGPNSDGPINWRDIEKKLDASTPPPDEIRTPYFFLNYRKYDGEARLMVVLNLPRA